MMDMSTAIKATVIVLVGLASVRVMRRSRASARHLVLLGTFLGLLTLPFALALVPPAIAIELPVARLPYAPAVPILGNPGGANALSTTVDAEAGASSDRTPFTFQDLMRTIWAMGVLALVLSLSAALWQLARIRRSGVPWLKGRGLARTLAAQAGIRRSVEVLFHEAVAAPLTIGLLRPAILLPSDALQWGEADVQRALVHELEHVRRGDWAVQLLARITCALYWFNPLVWIARRLLSLEAERACDDAVLVRGESTEYAEQLVHLAQRLSKGTPRPALAMAKRSDLSARVSAILDTGQRRGRAGAAAAVSTLCAMALLVVTIAPVRVTASAEREISAPGSEPAAAARQDHHQRPGPLDSALYEAAEAGDLESITRLLDAGANADAALQGDGSPLIGAARRGHLRAVGLLLDRGANPNVAVHGDGSPLIMAAREGHIEVVELLLDRGARVDDMVPDDENALIQASGHGRLAVVQLLVARRANVNARAWASLGDREGEWRTPLSMARRGGHDAVVRFLVAAGARE